MRLRDLKPDRRLKRRAEMMSSARAKVPNTNEWRLVQKNRADHVRHSTPRDARANPLWKLGQFLAAVAPYVDPNGSLGRSPKPTDIAYARGHLAFPGVPQDQLEALIPYLEKRIALSMERGNNARQRATMTWLAKWERAVWKELSRRIAEGDLPAPAVHDDLKLSYAEIEKARAEVAAIDNLYITHNIATTAEIQGEHADALIFDDPMPSPGLAAVAADIDHAFANVATACEFGMPAMLLLGQAPSPQTPEQSADLDFFYDRVRQDQDRGRARMRRHTQRLVRNILREHHARSRR